MNEHQKNQREFARWVAIIALFNSMPFGAPEELVLSTLQGVPIQITALELRKELTYLEGKGILEISQQFTGRWFCKLTSYGVDIHQYTVECPAGIARPPKYWGE